MSPLGCEGKLGFSGVDRQNVVGIGWPFCAGHGFRKTCTSMSESDATVGRPLGTVNTASFCLEYPSVDCWVLVEIMNSSGDLHSARPARGVGAGLDDLRVQRCRLEASINAARQGSSDHAT